MANFVKILSSDDLVVSEEGILLDIVKRYIDFRKDVADPSVPPPKEPDTLEEELGPEVWKVLSFEEKKARDEKFLEKLEARKAAQLKDEQEEAAKF